VLTYSLDVAIPSPVKSVDFQYFRIFFLRFLEIIPYGLILDVFNENNGSIAKFVFNKGIQLGTRRKTDPTVGFVGIDLA